MTEDSTIVIPFCIYHYIDPATKTYLGYIDAPEVIKKDDGTKTYRCVSDPKTYKGWYIAATFYAVSPMFRPIPAGMKIFCAKRQREFPYVTNDVKLMYDPYNIKEDCVYFTTYNQPVPNTVPLYFHMIGRSVFPSFDIHPPSDDPEWKQTQLSPVFVMTEHTIGDISKKLIKFKCINGRCLPWSKEIKNVFDNDPHTDLLELDECVLYCNELSVSKGDGSQSNLLQRITEDSKKKPVISRFFKKLSPAVIGVVTFLFIVFLFMVIYTLIKNKNENSNRYSK